MMYSVKLTLSAINQIRETIFYISHILQSENTAIAWSDYLKKEISSLDMLPFRYPLVETEPWKSKGIRKMTVKHFIVYYTVDETQHTVWITAVFYGKRDQIECLKKMPI